MFIKKFFLLDLFVDAIFVTSILMIDTQRKLHALQVQANVNGLAPGNHGFHIHSVLDLADPTCVAAGGNATLLTLITLISLIALLTLITLVIVIILIGLLALISLVTLLTDPTCLGTGSHQKRPPNMGSLLRVIRVVRMIIRVIRVIKVNMVKYYEGYKTDPTCHLLASGAHVRS